MAIHGTSGLSRFGDPGVMILACLLEGPLHGYAIIEQVCTDFGVRLGPGTLYGALAKLEAKGLVEPVQAEGRRRPYRMTSSGEAAIRSQIEVWRRVVTTTLPRLGLA